MKKQRKKKKSPQDATLRNVRAANRKLANMNAEITKPVRFCVTLLELLKSKRLLTPAQCKMLEDCLR